MRVLVADDDTAMAAMLQRGLREDGYAVDIVDNGVDAIWQASEVDYDAIVLDVTMPGADGFEVCRRLRAGQRWMPVMMLSARSESPDRVHGLDSGADDYLAKPFTFAELSARLRSLMRRGAPHRPTVLTAGNLGLDPMTRQAWRGDMPLDLSAKEFALLEFFLRRRGAVLSRNVILEHVWDFAYDRDSNIVDQYIAFLRRKIDRPFGLEQLETIRGAGYRLRAEPIRIARPLGPAMSTSA
ncbi:MAG: response regulator transcription factor [Jatrophihabitans sp.]